MCITTWYNILLCKEKFELCASSIYNILYLYSVQRFFISVCINNILRFPFFLGRDPVSYTVKLNSIIFTSPVTYVCTSEQCTEYISPSLLWISGDIFKVYTSLVLQDLRIRILFFVLFFFIIFFIYCFPIFIHFFFFVLSLFICMYLSLKWIELIPAIVNDCHENIFIVDIFCQNRKKNFKMVSRYIFVFILLLLFLIPWIIFICCCMYYSLLTALYLFSLRRNLSSQISIFWMLS